MKIAVTIARILVGALFIFSGLVKAIDPLGLSYKMEEFFEKWAESLLPKLMNWLISHSFMFSIIMITLEVVLGVALLVGWRKKMVLRLLLLLMLFFTFLTSYVLFSGKIRACGCFGDCIPLTPIQTFTKDIILLLLVLFLIRKQKYIEPIFKEKLPFAIVLVSLIATCLLQMHVVEHLPLVDCLPYKKGNDILELRKMPADATFDKFYYSFVYKKGNEEKEFGMDKIPDSTWTYVKAGEKKLIEKGNGKLPLVNDFSLSDADGNDSTEAILNQPAYYLFFVKNMQEANPDKWQSIFTDVAKKAKQQGMPIYVVTSDTKAANTFFNQANSYNLPVYTTDGIAIKTAARANPTIFVMKGPVVQSKYSWADLSELLK